MKTTSYYHSVITHNTSCRNKVSSHKQLSVCLCSPAASDCWQEFVQQTIPAIHHASWVVEMSPWGSRSSSIVFLGSG